MMNAPCWTLGTLAIDGKTWSLTPKSGAGNLQDLGLANSISLTWNPR